MSKKEDLLSWMREMKYFAQHDIEAWAMENGILASNATRRARELRKEGLIEKLSDEEKALSGFKCKDAVYRIKEKQYEFCS